MELTEAQYSRIASYLPRQRGNVSLSNRQVLNAILYVAEHGCKWRGLPRRFGNWHTIYTRMNRWSKNGVLDRVFEQLQRAQLVRIKLEAVSLDSTIVKVHPDGTGARKKTVPRPSASPEADGPPRFIWLPRMLAQPSRSHSLPDKPMMRPRGASGTASDPAGSGDGPRLRGELNPPTGLRPGVYPGRPAAQDARRPLGVQPGAVQAAQRNRASVPPLERLSSNLLTL